MSLEDIIRPGTAHGLDFVIIEELQKRTGVSPDSAVKFALNEMLANALDKDATKIYVDARVEGDFVRLEVEDNGSKKLSPKEIRLILDFDSKASSKRGFLRVTRGCIGNALKCIFGYSHALAESKGLMPPDIVVKTANYEFKISLRPNKVKEVIESDLKVDRRDDDGFTSFIVKFPIGGSLDQLTYELKDLIFATSMVNPNRLIVYNIFDVERGTLGSEGANEPIRKVTSALWYTHKQFASLLKDFIKARPMTKLAEFVSLFRGFTSRKAIDEILQELNSRNHDSKTSSVQFFATTLLKDLPDEAIMRLFTAMKAKSKPISKRSIPSALGYVGKEPFERLLRLYGWRKLRYASVSGIQVECPRRCRGGPCGDVDHVEFPYLIEVAIFDREDDGEGLKVYQCVNFMASMGDVFSKIFDVHYRLGRVGISEDTPVTVVVHLVSPVLKWLGYGKTSLDE